MAQCRKCGRRHLFLKLNNGLCSKCMEPIMTALDLGRQMATAIVQELAEDGLGERILNDIREFGQEIASLADYDEIASLMAFRTLASGERPKALAQELVQTFPELDFSDTYSAMLSKCAVAASAKAKYRALRMGMEWYIWRTARDGDRVRKSHQMMEGVVCNWNDPPNPELMLSQIGGKPEHPGYADKCRCIALPVIDLEDIQLPAKVHVAGKIAEVTTIDEIRVLGQVIRKSAT